MMYQGLTCTPVVNADVDNGVPRCLVSWNHENEGNKLIPLSMKPGGYSAIEEDSKTDNKPLYHIEQLKPAQKNK